jgi:hypothetical protein
MVLFDGDLGEPPKVLDEPSITIVNGSFATNQDATNVLSVSVKHKIYVCRNPLIFHLFLIFVPM